MSKELKSFVFPAIIPDDCFGPLTRIVPGELLPLGDEVIAEHILNEALSCCAENIIVITSPSKKAVTEHFTSLNSGKDPDLEKYSSVSFSHVLQKKITGSALTLLRAEDAAGGSPFALSFPDHIFRGKTSAPVQLFGVFRTSEKPVIGLSFNKEINSPYVADVQKIASRLYKVKKIVEREKGEEGMPAIVGRCILTGAVFDYLKKAKTDDSCFLAIGEMINDGQTIYGYELDGEWFPLTDHASYVRSNSLFSLKHSSYSENIRKEL